MMLSGYLTLGKEVGRTGSETRNTIKQNATKVFWRLVLPLVAFYAIDTAITWFVAWRRDEIGDAFVYADVFHNLSKNTGSSLYFLVVLALVQLLNPVWNILTQQQYQPLLRYVCRFFFLLGIVGYVFYYLSLRQGIAFNTFTFWSLWVGYYLYGYLVRLQPREATAKELRRAVVLLVSGFAVTMSLGFLILRAFHSGASDLWIVGGQTYADSYFSISVIAMSIGAFQLLMRGRWVQWFERRPFLKNSAAFLASLSFALYLIHVSVIQVQGQLLGIHVDSPSMPGMVGFLVIHLAITFGVSILLAWLWKKTPGLRALVGEGKRLS
jgi:hypothetical protein